MPNFSLIASEVLAVRPAALRILHDKLPMRTVDIPDFAVAKVALTNMLVEVNKWVRLHIGRNWELVHTKTLVVAGAQTSHPHRFQECCGKDGREQDC